MNKRIIINLSGLESGGGLAVATSILSHYLGEYQGDTITVIGRKSLLSPFITSPHVFLLNLPRPLGVLSDIPALSIYLFALSITRKSFLYINFSDFPTLCFDTQVFFFDWPYAVTPISSWGQLTKANTVMRAVKLFVYRSFAPFVSHYICQTSYIKSLLIKSGISRHRISVNPLGITRIANHSREYRQLSDPAIGMYRYPKYDHIIFCPNAYNAHKGFDQIIQLISSRFLDSANLLLVLLIDESALTDMHMWSESASSSQVVFLGHLTPDQMFEQYSRASIVLNPSQLETFGFAYYEAAVHGLRQVVPLLPHVPPFARSYSFTNNSLSGMIRSIMMALHDLELTGSLDTTSFSRDMSRLASRSFTDFHDLLSSPEYPVEQLP